MTSTTSAVELRTAHGRLRRLAAERPLTTFLVLGFSLAYTLAFVWGLAYHGVIPGGGLADALHIAPDELAGGRAPAGPAPGGAVRDLGGQRCRRRTGSATPLPAVATERRLVADGAAGAARSDDRPGLGRLPASGCPGPAASRRLVRAMYGSVCVGNPTRHRHSQFMLHVDASASTGVRALVARRGDRGSPLTGRRVGPARPKAPSESNTSTANRP